MRSFGKIIVILNVIFILTATPVFSLDLSEIQTTANKFVDSMAGSLPFNSTMGLNWSDAHIGQLLALPPHFGVGFSTGFTTMEFGSINTLLDKFNVSLPAGFNWGGFPLPGYTVEARVGGIILPFDIGVKFGILDLKEEFWDSLKLGDIDITMNYLLVGADLRYVVLGKKKTSPFKVSVGAGFNYMKGGISLPVPGAASFDLNFAGHSLELPAPGLNLQWETKSLDIKAQASVKVLVLTPYVGIGATHAWSTAGYGLTARTKIKVDGDEIDLSDSAIMDELRELGLTGITANGIEYSSEVTGWSFRVFGGFSINVPFVRFDLTAMYDFISKNYGATFGTRFQL
ncbi:MAG: hypothetical protein FWB77_00820 [Treponema sp.]|nr:hypothetical protein [Treponema sp.]